MYRGFVKLWRKTLDVGWLKNHKLWAFWSWCLMKASHKEIDVMVGLQQVHLMPGDFVFGRKAAAVELSMSEQTVRTNLDSLRKRQNITIKSTNKFTVISIVNWHIYQDYNIQDNQQTNTQLTSNQPTTNQQLTTNKNEKKNNNEKNEKKGIFIIPSLEEILTYCQERKNMVDAEIFHNHYTSNGWMVGKNKMRDWKASVRTWEKSGYNSSLKDHPLKGKLSDKGIQTYENLKNWGKKNEKQDVFSAADAGIVRNI